MMYRKYRLDMQRSLNFVCWFSNLLLFCFGYNWRIFDVIEKGSPLQLEQIPSNALRFLFISFLKICKCMPLNGYKKFIR